MQEKHLFEYAVIRLVPRVEREEFMNVGVILYCPRQSFLQAVFTLDEKRISAFSIDVDLEEVKENLCVFERVSKGLPNSGPIGKMDMASRFRWLTATRSTILQCSKVHPGFCADAQQTLLQLHGQLVEIGG